MAKKVLRALACFIVFCFHCKWYQDSLASAADAVIDLFRKEDKDASTAD